MRESLRALGELPLRARDAFLPSALTASPDTDADLAHRTLRRRTRRFVSLLLVLALASLASTLLLLVAGLVPSSLGALVITALLAVLLAQIRRGARFEVLGSALVCVMQVLGAVMGLSSGAHGMVSLFWVALGPTLTLSITGPRGARFSLVFTALLLGASIVCMYDGLVTPWVDLHARPGAHVGSLLGAMVTYFALVRAYEHEAEETIRELERNNAALREARVIAEAASRAKGEFLAVMSHEIRTPMNGVLGMTAVMLHDDLPERVREGLLTIRESGDTLMAVLNDVLDFSRIESGRLELESVPLDLAAELRTVSALLASTARERGNRYSTEVDAAVPKYVLGDPLRLRQVVLNLVSNGLKFTRDGEVGVRASVDGERLRIDVRDTGIGVAPEVLPTLFTAFKQADASTTRRFGGTGLGLAIVRQLVDAMGGHVSVTSEVGRGSVFTVMLPLREAARPTPSERDETGPTRRLRVLVAEDNAINQKVATLLLERLGHAVTVVDDGRKAVEAALADTFDLVLMDCHMPVMDGFEATRALREAGDRTPVVALTAASLPEERARCLASGMEDVVLKPVRRPELAQVLARYSPRRG